MDGVHVVLNGLGHFGPAAGVDDAEDRNQERAQPDQEELHHFVEDRGNQTGQGDIDGHRQRSDPDAHIHVPAEQQVQDLRHGEHAGPADHDRHEGERGSGHGAAAAVETEFQIAGNGMGPANIVERHHHHGEKDDRRDGIVPVGVGRQEAVLVGLGRPAHRFQSAEVGRDEAQARHPGGDFAAGHEEVVARAGELLQIEADSQHDREIDRDNQPVHGGKRQQLLGHATHGEEKHILHNGLKG